MALLSGCAGQALTPASAVDLTSTGPETYRGLVRYETREVTPTGVSRVTTLRQARHVAVRALAADGSELSRGVTDAEGMFLLEVPSPAARIEILASVDHDGHVLRVAPDHEGQRDHLHAFSVADSALDLEFIIPDEGGAAAAFHIVDTLLLGSEAVRRWTGRSLPPLFVYWARGVTTEWSFYRGERPTGSGQYAIELMGGDPGRRETSDTDEYDRSIILHEFGHFVMERLSTDSSPGGHHPSGHLVSPGLAWEEGRATWFAAAVLGAPLYLDSVGMEPSGSLRVRHDLERGEPGPRGLGSEDGVAEILWDLSDGVPELADIDGDGVAIGPAAVLGAMLTLAHTPGAYPAISTYLHHLVGAATVGSSELRILLVKGGNPESLLPRDGRSRWPIDVPLPARVSAKIDSLSSPAPSGGPPRHGNGQDAVDVYRVHVTRPGWLMAELEIYGSGVPADHQDLDLELRSLRSELLDDSRGEGNREAVGKPVEPGWYMLYVRDGGSGARVGYELRVRLRP